MSKPIQQKSEPNIRLTNDGESAIDLPVERIADPTLSKVFIFNQRDLTANRQGILSERQRKMRYRRERKEKPQNRFLIILMMPLVLLAVMPGQHPVITFIVLLIVLGVSLLENDTRNKKLADEQIRTITGRVKKEKDNRSITVNSRTFKLSKSQYNALNEGDLYTIYSLKNFNQILSLEYNDAAKDKK